MAVFGPKANGKKPSYVQVVVITSPARTTISPVGVLIGSIC